MQKKVGVYVKCLLVSSGQSGSLVSSYNLLYNGYVCLAGMCVGFSRDAPHRFFSGFSLGWYGPCHPKFSVLDPQLLFMFLFFLIILIFLSLVFLFFNNKKIMAILSELIAWTQGIIMKIVEKYNSCSSYRREGNFRQLIFSKFKFSIGFNFHIVITCRK